MGQSASFTTYEDQLLSQTDLRAYEVPNSKEKGASSIYRNLTAKEGFTGFLKVGDEKKQEELDTAYKLFHVAVDNYGDKDFVGFRSFEDKNDPTKRGDYKWMTYKTFWEKLALPWGNGLQTLGLTEKSNVGIFSNNRPEWYACHIGNLTQSFRTCALYATLGPNAVSYITAHAQCEVAVCEKDKLKNLFEAIKSCQAKKEDEKSDDHEIYKSFQLKYIVQFDHNELFGNEHEKVDDADKQAAEALGVKLLGFSEVLAKGADKTDIIEPKKEDLAYIMYTSGTTGNPKGVMLTHQAFAAMVSSGNRTFKNNSDDTYISYLPLAHIFEAVGQALMSAFGAKVAYYQGDIRKILDDWKDVRPTILVGVPRVYGKTYDKFQATKDAAKGIKGWLMNNAAQKSQQEIRKGRRSGLYDKLVWSKVAPAMGFDRVRVLVSGAAPLPPHVAEFLRIILPNAAVMQGYGMTETCAGGTATDGDDITLGHVGAPVDNMEFRLVDAPECGYLTTDKPYPRGEIQLRGLATMVGYYRNEDATKKTLSEDGWLSTGDIGRINPNNTLSIIDRRKNLFKISNGEYIASEKVEAQYTKLPSIAQCFVYGNSNKSFIVGVVVPEVGHMMQWFHSKGWISDADLELKPGTQDYADKFNETCKAHNKTQEEEKDEGKQLEVKKYIHAQVTAWIKGGDSGLIKPEQIRDFYVECEVDAMMQGFNEANNCLTPTFKKKRPQLTARYLDQIKALYAANGEAPKDGENW